MGHERFGHLFTPREAPGAAAAAAAWALAAVRFDLSTARPQSPPRAPAAAAAVAIGSSLPWRLKSSNTHSLPTHAVLPSRTPTSPLGPSIGTGVSASGQSAPRQTAPPPGFATSTTCKRRASSARQQPSGRPGVPPAVCVSRQRGCSAKAVAPPPPTA
eukprot:366031-Chlamydomonas_euryale.AAC.3